MVKDSMKKEWVTNVMKSQVQGHAWFLMVIYLTFNFHILADLLIVNAFNYISWKVEVIFTFLEKPKLPQN